MRACIHRGSKQIGGSCVEIESKGQRLLMDFGLPLDADENTSQYLPQIKGLDGTDPTLMGILISHTHLDHFGLLAHISPKIYVGMGTAARQILTAAAPFLPGNWPTPNQGWNFQSEQSFDIGIFHITPFLVDHSAYDSYALLIESEGKSIFYTGDFRAHGRKAVLFDRLVSNPPKNINAMLLEGSSLGRIDAGQKFQSENEIEAQLTNTISTTEGLALVHTSSQNIDRIVSIFRASKKTGRKLVIDLYTAAILEATANKNIPQSFWSNVVLFIPQVQRIQIKKNKWFDLLKRHASNRIYIDDLRRLLKESTLLFRPLHMADLEKGKCLNETTYIYSQWEGYWEQGYYDMVKKWLQKYAIPKFSIHTSGHASPDELMELTEVVNPDKVIPIHSFKPEYYPSFFSNVEFYDDGDWWDV